jgi:hypothetical protein
VRRAAIATTAAVVALAALVGLGRWEHGRFGDDQRARMNATFRTATVHGLISADLRGYRLSYNFDCLLYDSYGAPRFGLEVCFDVHGRLVETIDRRTSDVRIASLRPEPALGERPVPMSKLLAAFRAARAFADPRLRDASVPAGQLPVVSSDLGPRPRFGP